MSRVSSQIPETRFKRIIQGSACQLCMTNSPRCHRTPPSARQTYVDSNQDIQLRSGKAAFFLEHVQVPVSVYACLEAYNRMVGWPSCRYKKVTASLIIESSRNRSSCSTTTTKRVLPASLATPAACPAPPSLQRPHMPSPNTCDIVASGRCLPPPSFCP